MLSSCTRFVGCTGEGAVYTGTLLPPPCGISAIDSTLTPIIDQSSVDASLNITATLAVCGVTGVDGFMLLPPEPPPHAAMSAAATLTDNSRDEVENITKNSCS